MNVLYRFSILSMLLLLSVQATAQQISIKDIEISRDQGAHLLTARINYDFSEDAIEALHHGVDLFLVVEVLVKQQRAILWDVVSKRSQLTYKLEYHPLSERYVLTDLNRYRRADFQYLNTALEVMGKIDSWQILHQAELNPDEQYSIMLRARLDIDSLPAPLRLLAFISKSWNIRSDWYRWQLVI